MPKQVRLNFSFQFFNRCKLNFQCIFYCQAVDISKSQNDYSTNPKMLNETNQNNFEESDEGNYADIVVNTVVSEDTYENVDTVRGRSSKTKFCNF